MKSLNPENTSTTRQRVNLADIHSPARRACRSACKWWLFLAVWLIIPTLAFSQETPLETPSGQTIVSQAALQMARHPSLEAKMRQRVGIRDHYMVGSGAYLQLRHGEDVRFRLELRLQVGERLTSLQHITDSRYLYIRRDVGEKKSVSRIDLKRVHAARAVAAASDSPRTNAPSNFGSLGIGGLSQLLHGLADNFAFDDPTSETISGVNVWRMNGRWKTERLATLLPDQTATDLADCNAAVVEHLPTQLPDRVSLVVGRDGPLALFPYRVEFTRQDQASDEPRSMLIMELFEVRLRPDLDPRLFDVPDNDPSLVDETDAYLEKHGLIE